MSIEHKIQSDFSGGEISSRLSMRADTEIYVKGVFQMENFMPTLQGSVERTPGTRMIEDMGNPLLGRARIIPYLTPSNDRAIVEIREGEIRFLPNATQHLSNDDIPTGPAVGGVRPIRRQIMPNGFIESGEGDSWNFEPDQFVSNYQGNLMGGWLHAFSGEINLQTHLYKSAPGDPLVAYAQNVGVIPKDTAVIKVGFGARYMANATLNGGYDFIITIGTTVGASDLGTINYKDHSSGEVGSIVAQAWINFTVNLLAGAEVHVRATLTAKADNGEQYSGPRFGLRHLVVYANDEVLVGDGSIVGVPPWLAEEVNDIHFIQSPLMPYLPGKVSKELVLVHPLHPPQRLYYHETNAQYTLDAIIFTNQPASWIAGNYPATCGSYLGRLVLAGSEGKPRLGAAVSGDTETVWCTESGKWDTFSGTTGINPDDSVEFTTTYRSPIQWVYGQKDLLVGALELEYIASADGIFQPADLGVYMHSSHGSNAVQPAGFGEMVLFPAEGGTKVRAMQKSSDDEGWVAPDVTLINPHICSSGIRRMVRMRNPHQMLVVLLKNGEIAILHYDTQAQVNGWSRMRLSGYVKDICVMSDDTGTDVLFAILLRQINGVPQIYLEAIANWTESDNWVYMESHTVYELQTPASTLDSLTYLEGKNVQVTSNGEYLGNYVVTGGVINLVDQTGTPLVVNNAIVGLAIESTLVTMPLVGADPKSKKRYTQISARVRASTFPFIGVQSQDEQTSIATSRPPTRDPRQNVGDTQRLSPLGHATVSNRGWSTAQMVRIIENIPQRVEILGIYGKLQDGNTI